MTVKAMSDGEYDLIVAEDELARATAHGTAAERKVARDRWRRAQQDAHHRAESTANPRR